MALKVTLTLTIDDEYQLVDEQFLQEEFGGDWLKVVRWFAEFESLHFLVFEYPDKIAYVAAEQIDGSKATQGRELESVHPKEEKKP